jgi:NADH:ubiquinone reductase (H+-translocating)
MTRTEASGGRPQVVVVGAGFGGLSAARALRRVDVDVTVIDRSNHYLFQPLLYQVAAGVLSPADIAMPTRFLLRRQANATVLMTDVTSIDTERRTVDVDGVTVPFDFLIVATGARHAYFGHPEWEALAPGLKTLEDARLIRHRFLRAFEEAERTTNSNPADQDALLTFVIVGGGPTGVELAGVLPTIAQKGLRPDFRRIDAARARVLLLEAGPRLLPTFPESLSARALSDLETLGVQCRTGALVTRITEEAVYVGEERIPTRTVFWAAGNAASPLIRSLHTEVDRAGRALVQPDLSLPGAPHIFVVGDAAAVVDSPRASSSPGARPAAGVQPQYVPGVAPAANQMGTHAARMVAATLAGQPRTSFHYRDKGALAVIGRGRAVADFGWLKVTGRIGWWLWLTIHIAYLAGFRNRVSVLLEWAYAYFTFRPGARLITEEEHARPRDL